MKIEFKGERKSNLGFGSEFVYDVNSNEFEGTITVFAGENVNPFIYEHFCLKGGERLWGTDLWQRLCNAVLEYHNNKVKEAN